MSDGINFGVEELVLAAKSVARSDGELRARLQSAWTDHVQNLWSNIFLPGHLNDRFKTLWETYTAQSDDPRETTIRDLTPEEQVEMADAIVDLATDAVAAAARARSPHHLPADSTGAEARRWNRHDRRTWPRPRRPPRLAGHRT